MHKKIKLIIVIMIIAFVIPLISFNSIVEIKAGGTKNLVSGNYMKVKEDNPISVGDRVLITSTSRVIMSGAGGNPGYIYGETSGFYISNFNDSIQDSDDRIYANNSNILEFEVVQGSKEGTFAFKSVFASIGYSEENVTAYMAYIPSDDSTAHHYYGIQYWQCYTGFDDKVRDASSWNVSFDSEHGISKIENVVSKSCLGYRSGYAARMWFGVGEDVGVNIYKKYTNASISNVTNPTKTSYKPGEEINLSGLSFDYRYGMTDGYIGRTERINFDDDKDEFYYPKNAYSGYSSNAYTFEYLGVEYNLNFTISDYAYKNVDTLLEDYSGVYTLIMKNIYDDITSYYVPNAKEINNNADPVEDFTNNLRIDGNDIYFNRFTGKVKQASSDYIWDEAATFAIRFDGYDYYLFNVDGKYIRKDTNGKVTLSSTKGDPIMLCLNNGETTIKLKDTGETLCFNQTDIYYSSNPSGNELMLYQLYLTEDEFKEIDAFLEKTKIIYATRSYGTCINGISWNYLNNEFDTLTYRERVYISTILYEHGNELAGSIGEFIDIYDHSLLLEADEYNNSDFIGRSVSISFVKQIEGIIDDIGIVTLEDEDLVVAARKGYNALTEEQLAHFDSKKLTILEAAEEMLKVLKVEIIPLQQEAIDGDSTYIRFVFIIKNDVELKSADLENKLTLILDDGLESEQTLTRSPNVYKKLTLSGETYIATINEESYTFDNETNTDDVYVVYVVKFTTATYSGHNVKASLNYNNNEYKTSGYDFE